MIKPSIDLPMTAIEQFCEAGMGPIAPPTPIAKPTDRVAFNHNLHLRRSQPQPMTAIVLSKITKSS
jgi:hypothetical protein